MADIAQLTDKAALLAELRDVQVPAVSAWPALGWWLLLLMLVALGAGVWCLKRWQRGRALDAWRREALTNIAVLQASMPTANANVRLRTVQDASALLRRVLIHVEGRSDVAGLTQDNWLQAIERYEGAPELEASLQPLITEAPYLPRASDLITSEQVNALLDWLEQFVTTLPKATSA